ncbi:MAG: pyruvate carboxylase subunit B [Bacillota bacterium]|nr:pyruvate carboxylase subunit B [Bacillota bacterium]
MAAKAKPQKVGICDTTLRDGHQSLLATRFSTADILEVASAMDEVGFAAVEVWGGATFDTCMRYLNEDPWDRLRKIRKTMPKTKLQMLLRGQNLVGYRHYSDDVVDEFIKRAVGNGIDVIRIFDALNDLRNYSRAMEAAKKEGAHVQAAIAYTISPIHSIDYFAEEAAKLRDMGADSICIKDMAGLLLPFSAEKLVRTIIARTGLPVQMHSHYTSGMASMSYLKGIEAGAAIVDCAMSSMALASSQPAAVSIIAALKDTPYDTGLDLNVFAPINERLKQIRKKYKAFDNTDPRIDANVLRYQMPGGMISNFISQLKDANALDKLQEVLDEVPRVREDMGYPPLVTPTSQIVGAQALLNVLLGQRYKMATNEVKAYFRGEYGMPPGAINEQIRRQVIGDDKVITCRPADNIKSSFAKARKEIGAWTDDNEDVLLYIMFPQIARPFLEQKMIQETHIEYDMIGVEQNAKGQDVEFGPV